MTLNTELPQLAPEEFVEPKELPAPEEKVIIADINKKFGEKDFEIIGKYNLALPTDLLKLNPDELKDYGEIVKEKSKKIGTHLSGLKRTKGKDVSQEIKETERERKTIDSYSQTITDVKNLQTYMTPKKGKGIRYKQPKRQAYKIQDGGY